MLEVTLLGNGPSLSNINFGETIKKSNFIISCNRIFLHEQFDEFSERIIVCFSDLSFKNKFKLIHSLSKKCKNIYCPSDYEFYNKGIKNISSYFLKREKESNSLVCENIKNYPNVVDTCSVLFTIMLPLCMQYKPKKINLFGFDGTYSKNSKYFYKDSKNMDYKWNITEEEQWSNLFEKEMNFFREYCSKEKIELNK